MSNSPELDELMSRYRIALERERREESGLTPEELIEARANPRLEAVYRRRLIRENRSAYLERREALKK